MSIKGLTDRGSAFPEIGQIRKGAAKDPAANRPGIDLPYFRVEFEAGDPRGEKFLSVYGPKPTDINIVFPFNEMERNWDAWFEAYTAGRMVARSDGEFFAYLVDVKTGKHTVVNGVNVNGEKVPHREIVGTYAKQNGQGQEAIKMKPVGRLKVVIPELQSLAYLTVHTTSIYDIMNISSQLEAIQQMNSGRIAGVPLIMRRRKKMISTPDPRDKSKRTRREKYLISIEADPEWVKRMLMHVKHLALPGNGLNLLPEGELPEEKYPTLPAGSDNGEDEDETQEGEFDNVDETGDDTQETEHPEPIEENHTETIAPPPLPQRPYDPETLKRGLMLKSEKMATNAATVETQQVAASLSEILGGDDQRHELVKWLTDTATGGMKELTPAYIRSLNAWLKPAYNKNAARFDVDEMALKEATAAHAYVIKLQGQQELF